MCLGVICHLHCWQNDWGNMGVEQTLNKSQHRKIALEKKKIHTAHAGIQTCNLSIMSVMSVWAKRQMVSEKNQHPKCVSNNMLKWTKPLSRPCQGKPHTGSGLHSLLDGSKHHWGRQSEDSPGSVHQGSVLRTQTSSWNTSYTILSNLQQVNNGPFWLKESSPSCQC